MPFKMKAQEGSKRADWEESPMTQLRRGVVGVIAAFVVVSLSFSAQAAEKKKIMGTDKLGQPSDRTAVYPGDDPNHELVLYTRRDTTTSSDPDWNETEVMIYGQDDQVVPGTGTHRGYSRRLFKNGEIYGSFEGMHKITFKEDGSRETTWEGTWKVTGGTGEFKNIKGSGTYRGKAASREGASTEWEGEVEY
jgi:hypothetical protein